MPANRNGQQFGVPVTLNSLRELQGPPKHTKLLTINVSETGKPGKEHSLPIKECMK